MNCVNEPLKGILIDLNLRKAWNDGNIQIKKTNAQKLFRNIVKIVEY